MVLCCALWCQAQDSRVIMGAEQTSEYFPILKGKRIAIFSNHTGMVGDKHLLDVLIENKFDVVAIFSPEHGFRGDADAGEHVKSSVDSKTGVPILSLYDGKDKKQMIRFDIPAEVDPVVASAAITDEIDKGTKELVARMSDEAVIEVDIKKMAENGEIATIIVKDLSRFGRNYLEVGKYLEITYPTLGIRFIAIQENVDTMITPAQK